MIRSITALTFCTVALSACGLQGDLERPPPLWGNPPNEGPNDPRTIQAEREREAAEAAQRREEGRADEQPEQDAGGSEPQ